MHQFQHRNKSNIHTWDKEFKVLVQKNKLEGDKDKVMNETREIIQDMKMEFKLLKKTQMQMSLKMKKKTQ